MICKIYLSRAVRKEITLFSVLIMVTYSLIRVYASEGRASTWHRVRVQQIFRE